MQVYPAVFDKQSKQKGKGHTVRCVQRKKDAGEDGEIISALEIVNVDSVDKVYRIMAEHMKLGVSCFSCTCHIIFMHCNSFLTTTSF